MPKLLSIKPTSQPHHLPTNCFYYPSPLMEFIFGIVSLSKFVTQTTSTHFPSQTALRFLWRIRLSTSSTTVGLNCGGMKDEVDVEVVSKFMFSVRPVGVCGMEPCLLFDYTQHCMKVKRNSLVANRLSF